MVRPGSAFAPGGLPLGQVLELALRFCLLLRRGFCGARRSLRQLLCVLLPSLTLASLCTRACQLNTLSGRSTVVLPCTCVLPAAGCSSRHALPCTWWHVCHMPRMPGALSSIASMKAVCSCTLLAERGTRVRRVMILVDRADRLINDQGADRLTLAQHIAWPKLCTSSPAHAALLARQGAVQISNPSASASSPVGRLAPMTSSTQSGSTAVLWVSWAFAAVRASLLRED